MSLNVHIPEQGAARYTLYAKGFVDSGITVPEQGTFLSFEGVVLLFYSYPRHRRAYIVRSISDLKHHQGRRLPNVNTEVGVLYEARGRRIDILRKVYYRLEKINGLEVYRYDTLFWQKIGCLLDCKIRRRERKTAAGEYKRSYAHKANKMNLLRLSRAYNNIHQSTSSSARSQS
jgi:hypothetical protein